MAFASLAREGVRPPGDLVLALTADEEVGEDLFGMSWLTVNHPDVVRADFAVNEGGGERCVLGDRVLYLCAVGEKATAPFRLRLRGRAGHASDPALRRTTRSCTPHRCSRRSDVSGSSPR